MTNNPLKTPKIKNIKSYLLKLKLHMKKKKKTKQNKRKLTKDKNYPHILSHHSMPSQPSSILAHTCPTLTVTASNFPNPFATNIVHPMQTLSQSGTFKPKQCLKFQ